MTYLAVAVAGAAALTLVNLWLIVAMARRLRNHEEELGRRGYRPQPADGLPPGTKVPEFTVTTVTGTALSAEDLRGERSVIAFFSPACAPCHEQAPAFAAFAKSPPGGVTRTLAVICGGHRAAPAAVGDTAHLTEQLADATDVVGEPSAGIAAAALAVSRFPSFILLNADGQIEAAAHAVAAMASIAASA
jgi:thiol-disulfide isomerase/thioredoxin